MDPETTLAELRELARRVIEDSDKGSETNTPFDPDAVTLAEKFQALDEWLTGRGFLPADWAHPQPVAEEPLISGMYPRRQVDTTPGNPFTSPTAEELAEAEMAEIEAAADRAWEAARAEGKIDG